MQISSEIAQPESTAFVSATEESNDIEKETFVKLDPVPSAGQFNCLVDELCDSSKVENGSITVGLDRSAPVSISRFAKLDPVPSTEGSNCLVDELSDNYIAEKGGSSSYSLDCSPPIAISRDVYGQDGFGEHLKTRNMCEDDSDDICDSKIVSSKVQPCLAPVTTSTAREEGPENGASCQHPGTSNRSMVDEDISGSDIVSSHVQHCLEPATIASEDVLIQVQGDMGESSFSAGVPFSSLINYKEPVPHSDTLSASRKVQHDQGESSFSAAAHSSSLINTSGSPIHYSDSEGFPVQRDLGDSSFSAAGQFSSYSGSISLRSDSSATSTRSFAFPV